MDGPQLRQEHPGAGADPALRSSPQLTRDTAWWWNALDSRQLLIQRCGGCGSLRHPPSPGCGVCRSLSWDTVEASGQGQIHSFVVSHHPRLPGFDYPLVIALVELDEGTRLLANIVDCTPDDVHIGMRIKMELLELSEGRFFPQFRPRVPNAQGQRP